MVTKGIYIRISFSDCNEFDLSINITVTICQERQGVCKNREIVTFAFAKAGCYGFVPQDAPLAQNTSTNFGIVLPLK